MATPEANRNRLRFIKQKFNEQKLPKKKGRYGLIKEAAKDDYDRIDDGLRVTIVQLFPTGSDVVRAQWVIYDDDDIERATSHIREVMEINI